MCTAVLGEFVELHRLDELAELAQPNPFRQLYQRTTGVYTIAALVACGGAV